MGDKVLFQRKITIDPLVADSKKAVMELFNQKNQERHGGLRDACKSMGYEDVEYTIPIETQNKKDGKKVYKVYIIDHVSDVYCKKSSPTAQLQSIIKEDN